MNQDNSPDSQAEIDRKIFTMRDAGATWKEIEERFNLNRQQARYCYQRAKRVERRAQRRAQ